MVFVEIDRCVSDAIMAVTGCRPGRRTMRIVDYGKIAATFMNLDSGRTLRVSVKDCTHHDQCQGPAKAGRSRTKPFMGLSDEHIFQMEEVSVILPPEDMPGRLLSVAVCERCGEIVMDMRSVRKDGRTLCRPCAKGTNYYAERQDIPETAGQFGGGFGRT
jgi:formylmethanofuran dehydrogenase subunit E